MSFRILILRSIKMAIISEIDLEKREVACEVIEQAKTPEEIDAEKRKEHEAAEA